MTDRYFVENPIDEPVARLVAGEAHHLAHVMRAKVGDEVTLFDGSGAEFSARVATIGRASIDLDVLARRVIDRELPVPLTLAVALPKGDRQRWLVEKSTELGVSVLVPLVTVHGQERPAALDRLRRAVVEASKQCGRNRLMQISEPRPLADVLAATAADVLRLIAHPGGSDLLAALEAHLPPSAPAACLAVGPEGGFTGAEIDLATGHGWRSVGLGRSLLRIETAALGLTAVVAARLRQQSRHFSR